MLGRRGELVERQLARRQRALEQVIDATLQAQEAVDRIGNGAPLDGAQLLLAPQHALQRLVGARPLAADLFVDLEDGGADQLRSHARVVSRRGRRCQ